MQASPIASTSGYDRKKTRDRASASPPVTGDEAIVDPADNPLRAIFADSKG